MPVLIVAITFEDDQLCKGGIPGTWFVPSIQQLWKGFRVHINQLISVV